MPGDFIKNIFCMAGGPLIEEAPTWSKIAGLYAWGCTPR
jgi:hypothetical protein